MPSDGDNLQRLAGKPAPERRKCRVCMIPMNSDAENRIGVHVRCVYNIKQRRVAAIPSPRYGRHSPATDSRR